ncbi:transcription antitermination factor NusB [Ameyamaea chiangmaiensis NBRC 103196]|uniref:Transcription antitermination factor NusB n=1 Tax=Ameyamaea chiangmaiensis TaxID=442969 RepID=A0A850P7V2_9PROT|nr:transcription antitermination factor NusB [Ameyamaea chiangmaiensis]MBS4073649.1 transcription antitermination factor NusB [Ameyamaea chiangmaiensis]NVN39083.1 transcription antitermination factor NusB [Ameyamaea chiangmaiensis]GBQ68935.1 transcription antitermination factor NusB [Ameyamaea chiangmaiensis NBRC 103196]
MTTTDPHPGAPRSRTIARVAAVQALFQQEQGGGEAAESIIVQFERHRLEGGEDSSFDDGQAPQADRGLFVTIVRDADRNRESILRRLEPVLPSGWPLGRLDPVLRALLTAAVAELMAAQAPAGVIINEYLDVAHGFFSGDEPKMVNAILDRLAREQAPNGQDA